MRKCAILILVLIAGFIFPVFAGEDSEDNFAEIDALYFSRNEGNNLQTYYDKLNEMLKDNPNDGDIYWRLSRYHYWKGKLTEDKDEKIKLFEKAQEVADKGIEKDPKNPEVYYWSGVAMGMIGDTRGVLKSFFLIEPIKGRMNKTLELNPNHNGAHHVLGVMYRKLPGFKGGSNEKSEEELLKAIALKPNDTLHRYELAVTYVEMEKNDKALEQLQKVLDEENPADPVEAQNNKRDSRILFYKIKK
mgnify:CR=1 FL=1